LGEIKAIEYLTKNNYEIICTNYRFSRSGEIDIIARDGEYICFIEVKARSSTKFGYPSEAVNFYKQKKITLTAKSYLHKNKLYNNKLRFDVVEVYFGRNNNIERFNVIKNAF